MRRGRGKSRDSLNQAIDDLLGGDDDDIITPRSGNSGKRTSSPAKKHGKVNSPKKTLSSDASSKDFYSSLSAIAGHDISEGNDGEDIEVDAEDAANIAQSLGDMDDLESDLFGSFGSSKKSNQKAKGTGSLPASKQRKKKQEFSDFDEDDPLAGLGLSDDDDILSKKPKSKKPELSKKLSHTASKGKVDPNVTGPNAIEPDSSPVRSSSFDRDDPFLATDPRPRSGSGSERKFKRMNSWDEPSIGTQSESEFTPRSRSNSFGQQMKQSRKGSKKKKVNPSPPKNDTNVISNQEDGIDLPDNGIDKQVLMSEPIKTKEKPTKTAKQVDDIFADEDDLPGLSDDESVSPTKKPSKKVVEDSEPVRKATLALDDLLGGKSKSKESKGRKPTFLEQMMSKNTGKRQSADADSLVTSPREAEVAFGGYSPSVGGPKDRPTTAPNKRSVRFADELGFDELDISLNDSRPSTAPESGRSKKPNNRMKDATIGSSFEDDNTDISLDLSTNEFKRPSTPTSKAAGGIDEKDNQKPSKGARESAGKKLGPAKASSPRGNLQNTRRTKAAIGDAKQTNDDDWLGLDDNVPAFPSGDTNTRASDVANSAVKSDEKRTLASQGRRESQDDWLGLGAENVNDVQLANEVQANKPKVIPEEEKKNTSSSTVLPDDELFPWETPPGPRDRQRRRNDFRRGANSRKSITDKATIDSELKIEESPASPKREPVTHSTPKEIRSSDANAAMPTKMQTQPHVQAVKPDSSHSNENIVKPAANPSNSRSASQAIKLESVKHPPPYSQQTPTAAEQQLVLSQQLLPFANNNLNTPNNVHQSANNQDALLAQMFAAQRAMAMQNVGFNDQNTSVVAMQMEKARAESTLQKHKIEEFEIAKAQNQIDMNFLEGELRTLRSKINEMEEGKVKVELDSSKKIEDLEMKVRKLETENDHLRNSQDVLKKRHDDEKKAMENSHKMRFQILEDTYKRREMQLKEESEFNLNQFNERIKAVEMEKQEIISTNKERLITVEKNKDTDLERIKSLHRKAVDELRKDYEDQLERLRILKEQEVTAATSMFSQTKSLQSLIQQVQNSTSEVEQMQKRIDLSHKDNLNDREQSLRVRDEYLKSMQERLQRQEAESMEERSRLQTLVAKLEMQLREQGRQLEQDRWKVVQDENRVKALQAALEEERKHTMQQLNDERQMVDKSRDELMTEQRKILADCYEERRSVNAEKAELDKYQSKYNKESLEKEISSLKERESRISKEEKRLETEMQTLEDSFKNMNDEKQKIQEFAKKVQSKSKEVENLSKEAMQMQQEGIDSLEHAHALKLEVSNTSALLENRAILLDQQERELSERLASFEMAKVQFESSKGGLRCSQCQRGVADVSHLITSQAMTVPKQMHEEPQRLEQQQQHQNSGGLPSPAASIISSSITSVSSLTERQMEPGNSTQLQPPDVVLGSLNFNRTVRKWSSDKELDEEFFEEETRYLNLIQRKREAKFASIT